MTGNPRTLIGFDYGRRRIGVAVGQEVTASARPLVTLSNVGGQPDWSAIEDLLRQWQPDLLVVGVSRYADGSDSPITLDSLAFATELERRSIHPVVAIDERLSSVEARQRLAGQGQKSRRAAIDSMAAAVILETWMQATSP